MNDKTESIDDIVDELRVSHDKYLRQLADRIEVAHTSGVIKAMDELMARD